MNQRKILFIQKKIEKSKEAGSFLEALFLNYHLNVEILKFISLKLNPGKLTKDVKPKEILNDLISLVNSQPSAKAIIGKKNLKILKPWLFKMDMFIKTLRIKNPSNTKTLLAESEKIFAILNISLTKIFIGTKS
jgi:hypothetical protein